MDKFLIAPFKSGLKTDLVPFMIPEDSFTTLQNMFIYEGKIKRRPPTLLLDTSDARGLSSRLRVNVGTTDVNGDLGATVVPGAISMIVGMQFSVGTTLFTTIQAAGAMVVSPSGGATGTCNLGTRTITITGADPNTTVYWYPSWEVFGFATYFSNVNTNLEFAFDREFAYKYDGTTGGWERVAGPLFNATRFNRYSWTNFQGTVSGEPNLIVVNSVDNIRYYNDTTGIFTNLVPATSAVANYDVLTCRFLIPFEGRLLLLDTTEREGGATDNIRHKNRVRYSEFGDIFSADSWYQPTETNTKGGFVDLPAGESIICAEILDGRLIVFTDSSIYELVPTGNYLEPFQLALVDNTHGSESVNVVEVENTLLFVNNFGIYVYDGRNVNKISITLDDDYDNYEFRFGNIYKDSLNEIIYILMNSELNTFLPNRMLIYNYRNNTYSIVNDSYTIIGTHYHTSTGALLVNQVAIGGNQRGYTNFLGSTSLDLANYKNAVSNNIYRIDRIDAQTIELAILSHNLAVDDYIRIENSLLPNLNGSYKVNQVISSIEVRVTNSTANIPSYLSDATVIRIDAISIRTKNFNFYMKQGVGTSLNKVAINVNKTTTNGRLTLIGLPNGSNINNETYTFYIGDRKLDTAAYALRTEESVQDRVWRHIYLPTDGESVGINIGYTEDEILDDDLPYQELTINAIILYTDPAAYI